MTLNQKREFILELIDSVRSDIHADAAKVPENWDGHELRRWIADRFERSANMGTVMRPRSRRLRDYKNEILVRNL